MTHAALTPLLGREFDNFLFASIDDDRNGPLFDAVPCVRVPRSGGNRDGGRLPRGFCIKRLTDLPMLWSEQWGAIGLQAPAQVRAELR